MTMARESDSSPILRRLPRRAAQAAAGAGTSAGAAQTAGRSAVVRAWIAAFLGFFLLGGAWAIAMPTDGNPDELQHIERAYGAADLQLTAPKSLALAGRAGAVYSVPKSLIPPNSLCMYYLAPPDLQSLSSTLSDTDLRPAERGADCVEPAGASRERVKVASSTGRYSPVYYLPVGIPMLIHPTQGGIVAGRLVSAAMSSALLACAVAVAAWWRKRLLVAAVIVTATPAVVDLMGAINPSGFEIASGVAFWASLLPLARVPREVLDATGARRPLVALAVVSGALLLTIRGLGPLWAFLIVLACAAVARKGAVRELAKRRDMRITAGLLTVVGLAGIAYNVKVGGYDWYPTIGPAPVPPTRPADYAGAVLQRLSAFANEAVGAFGYIDVWAPSWMVTLWFMLFGAVLIPGLLRASRRHVLAIVGVIVVALGLTYYFDFKYFKILDWSQYTRYFLPFIVGAWMMAAVLTPDGAVSRREERRLPALIVIASVPAQLWALALVMTRFQAIGQSVNPFKGTWTPIWGVYAPVVAMVLGLVALGWLCAVAPGNGGTAGTVESSEDSESPADSEAHPAQDPDPGPSVPAPRATMEA